MINYLKKLKTVLNFLIIISIVAVGMAACNKSGSNSLESPDNAENPKAKARKVLMVLVDGGYGAEIRKIAPPRMTDLSANSIFSYDGLNSVTNTTEVTNDQGWATLFTGVGPQKHQVFSDVSTNNFSKYPTLFTRLKGLSTNARSVVISSSAALANVIGNAATDKKLVANDVAAKDAALAELNTGNPDLLVVQFSSVDAAGMADGYLASSPSYKAAVLNIDGYVASILDAMSKRANAPNEDWMVVITSAKGNNIPYNPTGKPWSAFDDARHNNFLIMANPRFAFNSKEKPSVFPYYGTTNSYRIGNIAAASQRNAMVKDVDKYNFGSSGNFSVQCKVKVPSGGYYYPSFLGKRLAFNTSTGSHGWVFFLEADYWMANFNGASGTGGNAQAKGTKVSDNQWHTLNLVVVQGAGTTRTATVYTDGVKNGSTNIAGRILTTTAPFQVGWRDGSNGGDIQLTVTDVRIWDRALSDAEISNNFCRTDADLSDPNLLGFWPSTTVEYDAQDNPFFRDMTASGNHLFLKNPSIVSFSEATPNACPLVDDVAYKTVPQSVDVAMQIYLWMGYAIPQGWGLEGQSWIPKYIDVVE
ncbi:MAG TPA: DUF4983 domain-containing protein [Niabella sp.]|nr:DUF4983 domain-containing protein [Chitinophagaceae bacterium]HRO85689.1 DUF4983 domain-containing protein [Niabella sp.]